MSICKLLWNDFIEGTLKPKRYILLIYAAVLQCMLVQINLDQILYYASDSRLTYQFREILLSMFAGGEPFLQSGSGSFPTAWFTLFVCPLFLSFDYMHRDLTQFGIQTLSRSRKRTSWWYAKCAWNLMTMLFGYLLILIAAAVFCLIVRIPLSLSQNAGMLVYMSVNYSYYTASCVTLLTNSQLAALVICPFLAMAALSLFQMALSLMIKPLYSLMTSIGVLILSLGTDWVFMFPRTGMIMQNDIFVTDGFKMIYGMTGCIIVILAAVFGGAFYFKHYDILPDKEENK